MAYGTHVAINCSMPLTPTGHRVFEVLNTTEKELADRIGVSLVRLLAGDAFLYNAET